MLHVHIVFQEYASDVQRFALFIVHYAVTLGQLVLSCFAETRRRGPTEQVQVLKT
jgi:hypothetical protein